MSSFALVSRGRLWLVAIGALTLTVGTAVGAVTTLVRASRANQQIAAALSTGTAEGDRLKVWGDVDLFDDSSVEIGPVRVWSELDAIVIASSAPKRRTAGARAPLASEATVAIDEDAQAEATLPARAAIARVLYKARDRVRRCYERTMVPGAVDLRLEVRGEDGKVIAAEASPANGIGNCVEAVMHTLRFPTFGQASITIAHPYRFR